MCVTFFLEYRQKDKTPVPIIDLSSIFSAAAVLHATSLPDRLHLVHQYCILAAIVTDLLFANTKCVLCVP